jgi:serine/threonine protein kinase
MPLQISSHLFAGWEISRSDFELTGFLGKGEGQVRRAKVNGMHCAAKKLTGNVQQTYFGSERANLSSLKREMEIFSQPRHRNIIRLLHTCTENDDLFIFMELAERGSLEQAIQDNPVEIAQSRYFSLLHGVVLGMKFLHAHNRLHSDLKPANILVSNDWTAKVAYFGSGYVTSANGAALVHSRPDFPVGTLAYQAPEIVLGRGGVYSMKSDVYSFAMTVYEAITGDKPWQGATTTAIVANMTERVHVRGKWGICPQPLIHKAPPFFRGVIESCWDHDPNHRPTFNALAKHFEEARVKYLEFREVGATLSIESK